MSVSQTNSAANPAPPPTPPPPNTSQPSVSALSSPHDIKHRIKTTYNAIAQRYLTWSSPSHPTRLHYLHHLLPRLPSHARARASVLELGCGAGIPCTQLLAAQPNVHVTANDISPAQLALAAQNLPAASVSLVEGDMMGLEFAPASFDAVVAMYAVIHLPRDEQSVLLERVVRWLRPGRWLLVNFCGREDEGSVERGWLGEEEGVMFWSGWGMERSCGIVEELGLDVKVRDVVWDAEEEGEQVRRVPFLWVLAEKVEGRG